jgi:hypothetical protein
VRCAVLSLWPDNGDPPTVVTALIVAVSGLVGAFVSWILTEASSARTFRRAKIAGWRKWVEDHGAYGTEEVRESVFWSEMRPFADRALIEMTEGRGPIMIRQGRGSPMRTALLDDIARIEAYWERPWWQHLPGLDPRR